MEECPQGLRQKSKPQRVRLQSALTTKDIKDDRPDRVIGKPVYHRGTQRNIETFDHKGHKVTRRREKANFAGLLVKNCSGLSQSYAIRKASISATTSRPLW
jgi:hypothetical protein